MDMFKMAKEAMSMRARLAEMDKLLKEKLIEVESGGVRITINAKSEIQAIKLQPEILSLRPKSRKSYFIGSTAATKKSQEFMAEEAKKLTGGMKIPGLS